MKRKLFRNWKAIQNVEPDSLWELINDKYVLVDDDEYVFVMAEGNEYMFYETYPTPPK